MKVHNFGIKGYSWGWPAVIHWWFSYFGCWKILRHFLKLELVLHALTTPSEPPERICHWSMHRHSTAPWWPLICCNEEREGEHLEINYSVTVSWRTCCWNLSEVRNANVYMSTFLRLKTHACALEKIMEHLTLISDAVSMLHNLIWPPAQLLTTRVSLIFTHMIGLRCLNFRFSTHFPVSRFHTVIIIHK